MKFLLVIMMSALTLSGFAQTYTVLYQREYWDNTYKKLIKTSFDELTVKDSTAYRYSFFRGNETKLPLGSEFRPHAIYYDLRHNSKTWQSQPYGGKKLLILDTVERLEWSIYDDTATIQGFLCQRATTIKGKQLVIAWFAPKLPCVFGPDDLGGLPGLILAVNYAGTTNRTNIVKLEFLANPIVAPSKGKPITVSEYYKYLDKRKPPPFRIIVR